MSDRGAPLGTASAAETERIGAGLAQRLTPGDIVLVVGEVGAGKSTLIRAAARALGVEGPMPSPTFTVGRRYEGRIPVSHLDLYRLEGVDSEEPGLLDDYLTPDAIAFIEWPEAARASLGREALRVEISHAGGDRRLIVIEAGAQ